MPNLLAMADAVRNLRARGGTPTAIYVDDRWYERQGFDGMDVNGVPVLPSKFMRGRGGVVIDETVIGVRRAE